MLAVEKMKEKSIRSMTPLLSLSSGRIVKMIRLITYFCTMNKGWFIHLWYFSCFAFCVCLRLGSKHRFEQCLANWYSTSSSAQWTIECETSEWAWAGTNGDVARKAVNNHGRTSLAALLRHLFHSGKNIFKDHQSIPHLQDSRELTCGQTFRRLSHFSDGPQRDGVFHRVLHPNLTTLLDYLLQCLCATFAPTEERPWIGIWKDSRKHLKGRPDDRSPLLIIFSEYHRHSRGPEIERQRPLEVRPTRCLTTRISKAGYARGICLMIALSRITVVNKYSHRFLHFLCPSNSTLNWLNHRPSNRTPSSCLLSNLKSQTCHL